MESKSLKGKTALVTGASRNIGRAIALSLADAGANIVVNTLRDREAAEAVASQVKAMGVGSLVQVCDVTHADAVEAMTTLANETFGGIDILISNASARGTVDFST